MADQKLSTSPNQHLTLTNEPAPNLAREHHRGDKQSLREKLRNDPQNNSAPSLTAQMALHKAESEKRERPKEKLHTRAEPEKAPDQEEELRKKNRSAKFQLEHLERLEKDTKTERAALAARTTMSVMAPLQPQAITQAPEVLKRSSQVANGIAPVLRVESKAEVGSPFLQKQETIISPALERKLSLSQNANELFQAMRGGVTGVGTDEIKIFKALEKKDAVTIRELRQIYFDHYGRELERDLKAELQSDKRYLTRLAPMLEGDILKSDVAGVRLQIELPIHDKQEIFKTLETLDDKTLAKFVDLYRAQYGSELIRDLTPILSANELKGVESLIKGQREKYEVYRLQELLTAPEINFNLLEAHLQTYDPKTMTQVNQLFQAEFAQTISQMLENKLEPLSKIRIEALLGSEIPKTNAMKLHEILTQSETPLVDINKLLQNLSEDERKAIFTEYQIQFGVTIKDSLQSKFESKPFELAIADKIGNGLKLTESEEIAIIVSEVMPQNTAKLLHHHVEEILQDKTRQEIVRIENELNSLVGRDLSTIVKTQIKGVEKFDLSLSLLGKPETLEDEIKRAQARYEYERLKLNTLSAKVLDVLSEQGHILDHTAKRVNDQFRKINRVDNKEDEGDEIRFYGLLDFLDHDVRNYRNAKLTLAKFISNASALLMGFFGFFVSARSGYGYIESLTTAVLFGGVAKGVMHSYISSQNLSGDSIVNELKNHKPSKNRRLSRRPRRKSKRPFPTRQALSERKAARKK